MFYGWRGFKPAQVDRLWNFSFIIYSVQWWPAFFCHFCSDFALIEQKQPSWIQAWILFKVADFFLFSFYRRSCEAVVDYLICSETETILLFLCNVADSLGAAGKHSSSPICILLGMECVVDHFWIPSSPLYCRNCQVAVNIFTYRFLRMKPLLKGQKNRLVIISGDTTCSGARSESQACACLNY